MFGLFGKRIKYQSKLAIKDIFIQKHRLMHISLGCVFSCIALLGIIFNIVPLIIYSFGMCSSMYMFMFIVSFRIQSPWVYEISNYIEYSYLIGILVPYNEMPTEHTQITKIINRMKKVKKGELYKYNKQIHETLE